MPRPLYIGLGAGSAALLLRERRQHRFGERLAAASLEALLRVIDANDRQTGAHVRRVATYALILARAARLSARTQRSVKRVALFHDIGKIRAALFDVVHDEVPLSRSERALIATHPIKGAEVLRPLVQFYPDLPDGVLAHHERWDGTGYPHGLSGVLIPLPARIVAIADSFDAMTHRRRYRYPGSIQEAVDAIAAGRGTQFDPDLADLFLTPEVQASVRRAMRSATAPRPRLAAGQRTQPGRAADVTSQWRPEAPAQPLRDQPPRRSL